ncbi:hypothetical protein F0562_006041 [Nyssa sinensis]|uniref:Uncharacterized protein n=1 Tax=Nyssa sinensis TaxID=561372 RepID=A0A5J5ANH7_9ASTE|nr:hypothetical protein F0562_006041 [Nyssa sinensis]
MAFKQPLSMVFIDSHGATNVSYSMQDSDLVSKAPHQTVTASTDHGANAYADSQVSKSSSLHGTADPSKFMVARTPMAPREALELEKDDGGFTLNSDFLINQCAAPRRSSPNGRREGRRNSGRGEWNACSIGANASTLQSMSDTSDRNMLQLPKAVSKP